IDIIHANDEHPDWIGGAHHHSETHTGHPPSISHHWTEGLFDHWLLTGDTRSLECAKLAADFALRAAERSTYGGGERDAGWLLVALMGAYRATGESKYLEAATETVNEVLLYLDPVRGVSSRPIYEQSAYEGGVPFMTGVLMRGLTAYYDETEDERVGWAICGLCDWLATEMMPAPGRFYYKQAPTQKSQGPQLLALEGAAFAWNFTGDATYKQLALDICSHGVSSVGITNMRDMPHALALLATALPPVSVVSVEHPFLVASTDESPVVGFSLRNLSGAGETASVVLKPAGGSGQPMTVDVPDDDAPVDLIVPLPVVMARTGAQRFTYEVRARKETIQQAELATIVLPKLPRILLLAPEGNLTDDALGRLGIPHHRVGMDAFDPVVLAGVDILLLGFDVDREPLAGHRDALAEWVRGGGVVLGFRDQSGHNEWLPSPLKQDPSYEPGEILDAEAPAFSLLHDFEVQTLADVHGGSMYGAFYDLGKGWTPLASAGAQQGWDESEAESDDTHYGLVQMKLGKGRITLCQLIPEYAWINDDAGRADSSGGRLLENLLGHACMLASR
ncbi:MAG TPA: hypothetical protein QGH10_10360, partial [Armatimonadota bacterium]|nr:hypothetical protein [Armatimonadota bacterium]